jgi:hypothetical protein
MCQNREVVRLFRGAYVVAGTLDTVDLRIRAVRLVTPADMVLCDHTAAWVHGADLLPPGRHHGIPPLSLFAAPDRWRTRHSSITSGTRTLVEEDIVDLCGLQVTSAIRTAWDLGRIRSHPRALAHLDLMMRVGGFTRAQLLDGIERFAGMRWVTTLRQVATMVDPRAESLPESMLRWHWEVAGLPSPEPQLRLFNALGEEIARLDLADEANRVAGEYDGRLFHGPEQAEHDRERREWIERQHSYVIGVFVDSDLFGPNADPLPKLFDLYARAGVRPRSPRS